MIPYGRQSISEKDIRAVANILRSDWITQGPVIEQFEKALAKYVGAQYAVAFCNGTAALHAASFAAGLKKGDEAIISPISFVATANCVIYQGATPRFADILPKTITIDPSLIKKKTNKKTSAILPVDFAGYPSRLEEIYGWAKKNNCVVIEDAAHALGSQYKDSNGRWHRCGDCSHADMAIFSFHPVKVMTTGEGGIVTTNNKKFYDRLKSFRSHGITRDPKKMRACPGPWYYEMQELGFNYRVTDFQCALGLSQLKRLDEFIVKRRAIVKTYNNAFSKIEGLITPQEGSDVKCAWHIYVLQLDKRNIRQSRKVIFNRLRQAGIQVNVHYIPIYYHPFYKKHFYNKSDRCPLAEQYYEQTITLPLYPNLSEAQIQNVIDKVLEAIKR